MRYVDMDMDFKHGGRRRNDISSRHSVAGFTLIELMIVVAVVARGLAVAVRWPGE